MASTNSFNGFTLVELMIAIAIISVIAVIAIPAYNGYITEARIATAQANMDTLKLFLEDYRLDNGCYNADCNSTLDSYSTIASIKSTYGWDPRKDDLGMNYLLSVNDTFYSINVSFSGEWVNCPSSGNCTSSY